MKPIFVDTVYLMALVNPRDQHHSRAIAFDPNDRQLLTTRLVLIEVADGFCRPSDRQRAIDLIDAVEANPNARIISADEPLCRQAYQLYRTRSDKGWSLTDCVSHGGLPKGPFMAPKLIDDGIRRSCE